MFELVIEEENGHEYVACTANDRREIELLKQRHIRSLTPGIASIREVEFKKPVKK